MSWPNKKTLRLPTRSYTKPGFFFVTICSFRRDRIFANVQNGVLALSDSGQIVANVWTMLPRHFWYVELDEFVVMPDHFHGMLSIGQNTIPAQPQGRGCPTVHAGSLAAIVRSFKSAATRQIRINTGRTDPVWQSGFYEAIIRSSRGPAGIRQYIKNNPAAWIRKYHRAAG